MTAVHATFAKTRPNDPNDPHFGWAFAEPGQAFTNQNGFGSYAFDDVSLCPYKPEKFKFVRDFYSDEDSKFTVPILWDSKTESIVNNESSEIIHILNSAFDEFAENPKLNLAPSALNQEMEAVDSWTYEGINNGVYKCGFAITQEAYDDAVNSLS